MNLMKQGKVSSSLTDFQPNISVFGAYRIMEDAITDFMGDLKIDGLTAKREYNAIWVFAKTRIKFFKKVAWGSEYTVTCFLSKISNVTIDIDVGIKDTAGELCIYSRTELCALDLGTGRIRRVSTVGVGESWRAETPLTDITFTKIEAENLPEVDRVMVKYSDIDYAVHTNNKQYVRFILDTYTVREMGNFSIREMEMVYVNQSHEGDSLTVHKGNCDGKDLFVIKKGDQIIAKSEILRDIAS